MEENSKPKGDPILSYAIELSQGERLFLYRRSQKLTQSEMAKELELPLLVYFQLEQDTAATQHKNLISIGDSPPLPYEACVILRRRIGWTQQELAKKIGVCRWWLNLMELGRKDYSRLIEWWNKKYEAAHSKHGSSN